MGSEMCIRDRLLAISFDRGKLNVMQGRGYTIAAWQGEGQTGSPLAGLGPIAYTLDIQGSWKQALRHAQAGFKGTGPLPSHPLPSTKIAPGTNVNKHRVSIRKTSVRMVTGIGRPPWMHMLIAVL